MTQGTRRYLPKFQQEQRKQKPRDPLHDPYKLAQFTQVDNQTWHDFKTACVRNGHSPVKAIEVLMCLYTEDKSFQPSPKIGERQEQTGDPNTQA